MKIFSMALVPVFYNCGAVLFLLPLSLSTHSTLSSSSVSAAPWWRWRARCPADAPLLLWWMDRAVPAPLQLRQWPTPAAGISVHSASTPVLIWQSISGVFMWMGREEGLVVLTCLTWRCRHPRQSRTICCSRSACNLWVLNSWFNLLWAVFFWTTSCWRTPPLQNCSVCVLWVIWYNRDTVSERCCCWTFFKSNLSVLWPWQTIFLNG